MQIFRIILKWSVPFMLICLAACSTNKAELRKQEEAMRDLGYAHFREGNFTKALQILLEAEKLYPDDHRLQDYIGQVYQYKGKPELAIEHYKKAIDIRPDYAPAKNNLSFAYLSVGRWDDAIAISEELADGLLYATPHYALTTIGYAYYKKNEFVLSETYYLKALELEPNHPPALKGLGRTYVELRKGSKAVEALLKVVRLTPQDPEVHYQLGRAYMMVGANQKAKQVFRKVIELNPNSQLAKDARLALNHMK